MSNPAQGQMVALTPILVAVPDLGEVDLQITGSVVAADGSSRPLGPLNFEVMAPSRIWQLVLDLINRGEIGVTGLTEEERAARLDMLRMRNAMMSQQAGHVPQSGRIIIPR